jgi:hypothetical protein
MDKQQRIEEVGKYIEKYYVAGNDDIELDDVEVKGFFDKISEFLAGRKEKPAEDHDLLENASAKMQEEESEEDDSMMEDSAPAPSLESPRPEFDLSTAKRKKLSQPMTEMMVGNRNLDDLMSQMDETFSQRLLRMIKERGMSESEAYKKAFVDRRHFSKIKKDEYYSPNKKTVLAFAIALELTLDETKDLLRSAGYALSRSSKFDIIIVYFLQNKVYDMFEINEVLYEYDQPTFG